MDLETYAAGSLGLRVVDNPFMILSFLALPVIAHRTVTERGLFDADRFALIPLSRT
ncbi:MAG: hypothetical protein MUF17_08245 [Syntrophales bacterium]|jgi:adenine deaminase|nr:hypothetical protein [Syntrophales bacterium]